MRDLTPRQQELLACLAEGLTDQQIADEMGLARSSVKVYLSRLYSHLRLDPERNQRVQAAVGAHCTSCLLRACHRPPPCPGLDTPVGGQEEGSNVNA